PARTLSLYNACPEPVHVDLGEQHGAFTPLVRGPGAAIVHRKGTFTPKAMVTSGTAPSGKNYVVPQRAATPAAPPWTDIADFPTPTMDNAVAYGDGKVYS